MDGDVLDPLGVAIAAALVVTGGTGDEGLGRVGEDGRGGQGGGEGRAGEGGEEERKSSHRGSVSQKGASEMQ